MKKYIAIVFFGMLSAGSFAQESQTEAFKIKAKSELDYKKKSYTFTPEQEKQLLEIYFELQKMYNDVSLTADQKVSKEKVLKDKEAKILAVSKK